MDTMETGPGGTPAAPFPEIISVDDHTVEPPNACQDRLPKKYRDIGPRVVRAPLREMTFLGGRFAPVMGAPGDDGPIGDWWVYEDPPRPLTRQAAASAPATWQSRPMPKSAARTRVSRRRDCRPRSRSTATTYGRTRWDAVPSSGPSRPYGERGAGCHGAVAVPGASGPRAVTGAAVRETARRLPVPGTQTSSTHRRNAWTMLTVINSISVGDHAPGRLVSVAGVLSCHGRYYATWSCHDMTCHDMT